MSTFDGRVAEFPDIRVDFFRRVPDQRPPLACFLSHVHSDHLAGLESLRSPFVYCSAATRELLLQLERFPCRINYARGILEARKQTYKHLKNLLKPIPLQTPTVLELEPGHHIQVTLFDANHCPGAVMFLYEGRGKAVLYTGDIRSEPWFVTALSRSPCLAEHACGLKTLDAIYLDTSFIGDLAFPPKADGIRELLQNVARYPPQTIFHLQAWTYGYEDVWLALSKALGSKIHVDEYKLRVYRSLAARDSSDKYGAELHMSPESPALNGFMCGNAWHGGCLTSDEGVRLHSCEKGNYCSTVRNSPVVWIRPVIAHLPSGEDIAEAGVGGGGDDLEREAELDRLLPEESQRLLELICGSDAIPQGVEENIRNALLRATTSGRNVSLDLDMSAFDDEDETALANAVLAMARRCQASRDDQCAQQADDPAALPRRITFPYSRHSSYPELCHLVAAFRPRDVWPCTVDPRQWARDGTSVQGLFGAHCSGTTRRHDVLLQSIRDRLPPSPADPDSQTTDGSLASSNGQASPPPPPRTPARGRCAETLGGTGVGAPTDADTPQSSQGSTTSRTAVGLGAEAFQSMLANARGQGWRPIGLISARDNHTAPEQELGERASPTGRRGGDSRR